MTRLSVRCSVSSVSYSAKRPLEQSDHRIRPCKNSFGKQRLFHGPFSEKFFPKILHALPSNSRRGLLDARADRFTWPMTCKNRHRAVAIKKDCAILQPDLQRLHPGRHPLRIIPASAGAGRLGWDEPAPAPAQCALCSDDGLGSSELPVRLLRSRHTFTQSYRVPSLVSEYG